MPHKPGSRPRCQPQFFFLYRNKSGFVMMGNITLDERHRPLREEEGLFLEIPNFLQETAFIDRVHGLISGWEMGRVTKDMPSHSMGFKGDFFIV